MLGGAGLGLGLLARSFGGGAAAATLPSGYAAEIMADGITAQVTFPSFTAPAVYSLTPDSTAKVTFVVTTPAYSGTTYGTRIRTIVGTAVRRKVYPNHASLEETQSGSDVITEFMLSEPIFSECTVLMTVLSGWATDSAGGGGEAAETFSSVSITNNSTQSFQKPVVRWNIVSEKNYWDTSGDLTVSVSAFSIHPYDGEFIESASFTFTDGSNTVTKDITASSLSSLYSRETTNGTRVTEHAATFSSSDVSGFTDGQCYIDAVVRSNLGDNNAESNPGVGSAPLGLGRFEVWLDAGGSRPPVYAVVNPGSAGGDPAVHTSRANALADADGAYADFGAAKAAIVTHNNSNHSYNGSGNGHIIVKNGTYTVQALDGTIAADSAAQSVWLTVEAETAGSVTITNSANLFTVWRPDWIKFENITFSLTGNVSTLYRNATDASVGFWLDGCTCTGNTDNTELFLYDCGKVFVTDCAFTSINLTASGLNQMIPVLIRGCDLDNVIYNTMCFLGNRTINECSHEDLSATNRAIIEDDENVIYAYSKHFDTPAGNPFANFDYHDGLAVVQNVFENNDNIQPVLGIGQDTEADMNNVVCAYNTGLGGRFNYGYNNDATTDYARTFWALDFNLFETINEKDDVNASRASSTGDAFTIEYSVGSIGNLFVDGYDDPANNFTYIGINSVLVATTDPTYTDDASQNSGDGTGRGTYTLTAANDAGSRVPSGRAGLSFDLGGSARNNDGSGAAGAYEA